jgi:hypothetical protein
MLVCFITIWNTLRPFGIIYGHFGLFFPFGMFGPGKIWQPCVGPQIGRYVELVSNLNPDFHVSSTFQRGSKNFKNGFEAKNQPLVKIPSHK